ncbi:MAG: Crp/Fnr family transcriptional regulator [Firmicutes bacterium]|nr:Crp/Fnr family transcriptional regulator [Bacillota bacterium]
MDRKILEKCTLFRGLNSDEKARALSFFRATERRCKKGESLSIPGVPLKKFGLVLSGGIMVFMDDFDGNRQLMASVQPGSTFGESLCFLGIPAQVMIESVADSEILELDAAPVRDEGASGLFEAEMRRRFTAMLAERTLAMNDRIQILSKPAIRSKVITLLSQYHPRNGEVIKLPFGREAMARYLGVNQSALSRELSRMKAEGIIDFKGSEFRITGPASR